MGGILNRGLAIDENNHSSMSQAKSALELTAETSVFTDCHVSIIKRAETMHINLRSKKGLGEEFPAYCKVDCSSYKAYFGRVKNAEPQTQQTFELPATVNQFIMVQENKYEDDDVKSTLFSCVSKLVERDVCQLNEQFAWVQGRLVQRLEPITFFKCKAGEIVIQDGKKHVICWRMYLQNSTDDIYAWEHDDTVLSVPENKENEMKSFADEWRAQVGFASWYRSYLLNVPNHDQLFSLFNHELLIWSCGNGKAYLAKYETPPPGVTVQFVRDGKIHALLSETPYYWENGKWHF